MHTRDAYPGVRLLFSAGNRNTEKGTTMSNTTIERPVAGDPVTWPTKFGMVKGWLFRYNGRWPLVFYMARSYHEAIVLQLLRT